MKSSHPHRRSPRGRPIHGALLRYSRNAYDLTQEELAFRAGVSDRLVRLAESGHSVAFSSIQAIAEIFDVPASALMSDAALARTPVEHLLGYWLAANWSDQPPYLAEELVCEDVIMYCEEGTVVGKERVRQWAGKRQRHYGPAVISLEEFSEDAAQISSCRWRLFYRTGCTGRPLANRVAMTTVRGDGNRIAELWEFWASNTFVVKEPN